MSLSTLPLSYCTNVHPARSLADVQSDLARYSAAIGRKAGVPIAAGLWLQASVIKDLFQNATPLNYDRPLPRSLELRDRLADLGLSCHTLNAFPYGDFHSPRVKEQVYLPDWSDPRRKAYTLQCAQVLAALIPENVEGSISTLPLGFKGFSEQHSPDHLQLCINALLETAAEFDRLWKLTGRLIRVAIEPEPYCLIETTAETIEFFARLFQAADDRGVGEITRRHLGLCYDVCHQAVEFEDVVGSIRDLHAREIRINKVHITCAIELPSPGDNAAARSDLAQYAEPRYLHQTMGIVADGSVVKQVDLTPELALNPPHEFLDAETWRIHFHVPVNLERLGESGLRTTRPELVRALAEIQRLPYAPHLEVETYTWPVLPSTHTAPREDQLIAGLTQELTSTRELLSNLE